MLLKRTVYNKIFIKFHTIQALDSSNLVRKTECNVRTKDIDDEIPNHSGYITTSDFNIFSGTILKRWKLATNIYVANVEQRALENKEKNRKLQTLGWSYFLGKNCFGDDGFQNMLVSQPTFDTLDIKQTNDEYYLSAWKSTDIFNSELKPLHNCTTLTKYFERIIQLQFNKNVFVVEQSTY